MNKRHTGKLLAFLLAVVFMFTLIPQVFADDGPVEYFYIHDGEGDHDDTGEWTSDSNDIKSFIIIKDPGGVVISPDGDGNYHDVPAMATIGFQIGFHLSEESYGTRNEGDYFELDLPSGVTYPTGSSGPVIVSNATPFASWEITNGKLRITLTEGIGGLTSGIYGVFGFDGTFQYLEDADEGADETDLIFGGTTITINRKDKDQDPKPVDQSSIKKSHLDYVPGTGELIWEIVITPPNGDESYDYGGFTLHDALIGNHHYKENSFKVGPSLDVIPEADAGLEIAYNRKSLEYTFPEGATGPQTITYATVIDSFEVNADGKIEFENKARLKKGSQNASKEVSAYFGMGGFFEKTGKSVVSDDGEAYVQWQVKVTLPQTAAAYVFTNAKIIDHLTETEGYAKHEYVIGSEKPVIVTGPDSFSDTFVIFDGEPGSSGGSISLESPSETLTYSFPANQPKTSTSGKAVYSMTYYTKITDWDSAADDNEEVKVNNHAEFVWENEGGTGEGESWELGAGVEKGVIEAGGLISKKAVNSTAVYDYSKDSPDNASDYIKWEITVNRNRIPMNGFLITDALIIDSSYLGHELVIDEEHPLEIAKNENHHTTFTQTANQDGFKFILGSDVGFTLELESISIGDESKGPIDSYTITFFTKITDLDVMYANGSRKFKNRVTLTRNDEPLEPVDATKEYQLQMLEKKASTYDFDTRTLEYSLVVNRNKLPLNGATLVEKLPSQTLLWPVTVNGSIPGDFKVYVNGAITAADAATDNPGDIGAGIIFEATGTGFKLTLPSTGTDPGNTYKITYVIRVEEEALLEQNNSFALSLTNLATLDVNIDDVKAITDTTTTKPKYKTITKEHDYKTAVGGDIVNWTVGINPGLVDLNSAYVEDILSQYLKLIADSVTLYMASVNGGNGQLTEQGEPLDISLLLMHPVEGDEQHFRLDLPNGPYAYILKFSTLITENNKTIKNEINLKGFADSGEVTEESDSVVVDDRFAFGGSSEYILKIKKVKENGEPFEGVSFGLFRSDGTPFVYQGDTAPAVRVSNSEGLLVFDELPNWSFTVKEMAIPTGYLRAQPLEGVRPTKKNAGDDGSDIVPFEIINKRALADVRLLKINKAEEELNGGLFEIFDAKGVQVGESTAENGEILFKDLEIGEYTIIESQAPNGYFTSGQEIPVTVGYSGDEHDTVVSFTEFDGDVFVLINDYDGKITIKKTGASGALKDVTFELLQIPTGSTEPTDVIDTQTTDEDGIVGFTGLPLGTYYVRETAAPGQYHLPSTLHEFVLTTDVDEVNETVGWHQGLELRNYLLTDSIILTKTDPKGVALDGGWFGLYTNSAATGEPMDKVQADGGQVVFTGILPGTYYVREIEAPAGYVKSDEIIRVDVSLVGTNGIVGEVVEEPLVNDWAGVITLVKTGEAGKVLPGAVFELLDADKKVLKEVETGKDGTVTVSSLPMGTYYLREKTAPEGYVLDESLIEVVLKAGAEADMVKTLTVENELLSASVTVKKVNQHGDPVSGGLFGIYAEDDIRFESPLQKVASVDGLIVFEGMLPGVYFVREIEAPKDYKKTDEAIRVVLEIDADGILDDLEAEEPLVNTSTLLGGDGDEKDDDLVETGGFLDTAMLWFFGTLLILAGAILLLRMRAALVRK